MRASSSDAFPETMRLLRFVRHLRTRFVHSIAASARSLLHRRVAENLQRPRATAPRNRRRWRTRLFDGVLDRARIIAEIHERRGDVGFQLRLRRGFARLRPRPRRPACRAAPPRCVPRSFVPRPGCAPVARDRLCESRGPNLRGPCPERIFSASEGPTPEAEISSSKHCFSRAVRNP